jgi:hypothetical protein
MAFIIVIGNFPPHKGTEVGKLFLKLPKLPDFVKTKYVFIASEHKVGFYSIYEVPEDKYFEGIKAISKRYTGYNTVEGYEWKLVPVLESKDALALLGLG